MRFRNSAARRLLASAAVLGVVSLTAGGCTSTSFDDITGSVGSAFGRVGASREPQTQAEWRREAARAGERYRANPRDAEIAMHYAEALRQTGQHAQAAAVLQQASLHHPRDKRVLGAYGRALADVGRLPEAMHMLSRAHTPDQPNWRVLSAQGAVADQMGRHEEARRYYAAALDIVPNEPSVLSNLGLSWALSKDLKKAESILRKAAARSSDRRVRQNLALVVGLQGRFQEAEEIARRDLPAEEAAKNVAYLKQMLAEQEGSKSRRAASRKRQG